MENGEEINKSSLINNKIKWSKDESKFLTEMYTKNYNKIGPHKQFRSKLHLWNEITKRLNSMFNVQRTTVQCIGRFKSMQKKSKDNIGYQNESIGKLVVDASEMSSSEDEPMNENISTIAEIIRSTLLEIHQLKEEAKERRHRERLHLLRQLLKGDDATNSNMNINLEESKMGPNRVVEKEPIIEHELEELDSEPEPEQGPEPEPEPETELLGTKQTIEPTPLVLFESAAGKQLQSTSSMQGNKMQLMRARLLEMQRKKMEDRERKQKLAKMEQ